MAIGVVDKDALPAGHGQREGGGVEEGASVSPGQGSGGERMLRFRDWMVGDEAGLGRGECLGCAAGCGVELSHFFRG